VDLITEVITVKQDRIGGCVIYVVAIPVIGLDVIQLLPAFCGRKYL
jgi:hypothetical protein